MDNPKEELKAFILSKLAKKLERLDIKPAELAGDFDLVKSGLLDSMVFVDLVVAVEKEYNIEIDFETAFLKSSFTTLDGLSDTILKTLP